MEVPAEKQRRQSLEQGIFIRLSSDIITKRHHSDGLSKSRFTGSKGLISFYSARILC
jgi:hypothetical protein